MKTIRPITEAEIAALRAEPQLEFEPHCVYSGAPILLPARITRRLTPVFVGAGGYCWRVKGASSGNGFANVSVGGLNRKVHRVVYTMLRGPIPAGHVLDHKKEAGCKFRDCANPDHHEPVTVQINTHRGDAKLFRKP